MLGTDLPQFQLASEAITRKDRLLSSSDGTLAGADIDMLTCIRKSLSRLTPLNEALRMASLYPAQAIGRSSTRGWFRSGSRSDFVVFADATNHDGDASQEEKDDSDAQPLKVLCCLAKWFVCLLVVGLFLSIFGKMG